MLLARARLGKTMLLEEAGLDCTAIADTVDRFQKENPQLTLVKAPYLNDHPLVLEAFIDKLNEVDNGSPNMNCQLCQYRVQIVGNEHKVGTPQESHHHHVEGLGTDREHSHRNSHIHSHSHEH